jgi:hypothetical protein
MPAAGRSALPVVSAAAHARPLSIIANTDNARAVAGGIDPNVARISDIPPQQLVLTDPTSPSQKPPGSCWRHKRGSFV